jgi:hypothetical protein
VIDECLLTSLTGEAHEAGQACGHVNFIGVSGYKDWQLANFSALPWPTSESANS